MAYMYLTLSALRNRDSLLIGLVVDNAVGSHGPWQDCAMEMFLSAL